MQKEKIRRKNKGITLIALVITIIVMLILVGVTVSISLNGGLFTTAKEATAEMQIEIEKEQLLTAALGTMGRDGKIDLEKLDSNLPEGFEKTGEGTYKSSTGNIFTVGTNGTIALIGGSNEGETEEPVTPTIAITPETITGEIESGTTGTEVGTITATVSNVEGDLQWSITPTDSGLELVDTDNENVKKVTATKAVENATIIVSYGTASDTCSITITEKEEVVEDELAGTWVFNDTVTLKSNGTVYYVNFESCYENWSSIQFIYEDGPISTFKYMCYGNYEVLTEYPAGVNNYPDGGFEWVSDTYKTIVISTTLEEMENGEEFLTWLQENAVKQSS